VFNNYQNEKMGTWDLHTEYVYTRGECCCKVSKYMIGCKLAHSKLAICMKNP